MAADKLEETAYDKAEWIIEIAYPSGSTAPAANTGPMTTMATATTNCQNHGTRPQCSMSPAFNMNGEDDNWLISTHNPLTVHTGTEGTSNSFIMQTF